MLPGDETTANGSGPAPVERFLEARATVDRRSFEIGASRFVLFDVDELAEAQIGYAVGVEDEDLTGHAPGEWRPLWLVVGEEESTLDALFVDLEDDALPVLVAADDADGWAPVEVAESFAALAVLLAELAAAAEDGLAGGELLLRAEARLPAAGLPYWRRWLAV